MANNEELLRKIAERRAARAATAPPAVPVDEYAQYADLIPEVEYSRSDEDKKLDTVIGSIDIVKAYRKWINKSPIKDGVRSTEGIKVSCPMPGHRDTHPSAWLNTEKNVWYCGACSQGGDVYDLAAIYHSFPIPDYKNGATFHELRRAIAADFGYSFVAIPGSRELAMLEPESGAGTSATPAVEVPERPSAPEPTSVTTLSVVPTPLSIVPSESDDDEDDEPPAIVGAGPQIEWRELLQPNTFLHKYMQIACEDDLPEEYHFWNAMTCLGFTVGRNVRAYDRVPILANLFLCTLGDSGSGKSQAAYYMKKLLDAAFPWDSSAVAPDGVKIIGSPGSAEHLIHQFDHQVSDPTNPKKYLFSSPVMGLIEFNELSSLTGRAARTGNILKPVLMEFYDGVDVIQTGSMTSGVKTATKAFASCHTTTQPKALSKLLHQDDSNSGFLNRWFFVGGRNKKRVAIGGKIIDMGPAVMPLQAVRNHYTGTDVVLPWDEDAHMRFEQFFHTALAPIKVRDADGAGILTRIDLFFKKMIFLFTLNLKADSIPLEAVEMAISLLSYVMECYQVPADRMMSTTMSIITDDVLIYLRNCESRGKSASIGDINKAMKQKRHQAEMIKKALDLMVELGEVNKEVVNSGKRGRPTVRFTSVV